MSHRACGICGDTRLKQILDLGDQPMAENDDGRAYPLALLECRQCGLVQLSHIIDQRHLFPPGHPYTTGNTQALVRHFGNLADELTRHLKPDDLMVDIGANDGTLLQAVRDRTYARVLGVEPTGQADRCAARGIPVVREFFTNALAKQLVREHGRATVVVAANVLAHVPDPHDFLSGVRMLLNPSEGQFVTENHDWASVANGLQIDTVYHEHLRYYSIGSLSYLLSMHGFLIQSAVPIDSHGGSFRVSAIVQQPGLAYRAEQARDQLRALLKDAAQDGPIYGIGAATRATPLIHYAGLAEYLTCVCEVPGSDKIGRTMPGTHLPVVDEKALIEDQPPHALLFPWHLASSLVPVLRKAGYRGKFIVPLPVPEVLDA